MIYHLMSHWHCDCQLELEAINWTYILKQGFSDKFTIAAVNIITISDGHTISISLTY